MKLITEGLLDKVTDQAKKEFTPADELQFP